MTKDLKMIVVIRTWRRARYSAHLGQVAQTSGASTSEGMMRTRLRAAVVRVEEQAREESRTVSPGLQG